MKAPLLKRAGLVLVVSLGLGACAPEPDAGIALKIAFAPPKATRALRAQEFQPGDPPPDITDFRLCVSAPDAGIRCEEFSLADYAASRKARIGGLPAGNNRKVSFQGFSAEAGYAVIWCGEVSGVSVRKGQTTRVGLFISTCGDFSPTVNDLSAPRLFHSATLLADGRVLIAGGFTGVSAPADCVTGTCYSLSATAAIDVFDPRTGAFTSPAGLALTHPRGAHTASLLPDGRVLVAGGCETLTARTSFTAGPADPFAVETFGPAGTTLEIIDLAAGTVSPLAAALPAPRAFHRDHGLTSGDVLLIGGATDGAPLSSIARYRAADGQIEGSAGTLQTPRAALAAVALGAETVVLWGGNHPAEAGAGIFSERLAVDATGAVSSTLPAYLSAEPEKGIPTFYGAGSALPSGRALITGGLIMDTTFAADLTQPLLTAAYRVIDLTAGAESIPVPPDADTFSMGVPTALHSSTLLDRKLWEDGAPDPDLRVMCAGGLTDATSSAFAFAPQSEVWFYKPWAAAGQDFAALPAGETALVSLTEPRAGHTATLLDDGRVLVTGGFFRMEGAALSATAEVFNPAPRELQNE